jgi:hypothetical protein
MWRRTYIFLVLVRLWFALSPSYLHPDENFQGPEVIAGMLIFSLLQAMSYAPLSRLQFLDFPAALGHDG